MKTIILDGLKNQVRHAFEVGEFLTEGRALPRVDFGKSVAIEVTATDTLGLYPTLLCEDDEVVDHGRQFSRRMHLKMAPGCQHEDAIMKLVTANGLLAREFSQVKDVRVCLKTYSVLNG
ncbi:hypothetical protein [Paraburkholderia adhaesiva]|uniref:hypothetical protein n=1 Tax=Paraburkholderia adhaesiva TaxID=2883244 RepID=UPI001F301ADC|nr:hypothetical protein [Paraburkholderia adhaesiva]